MNPAERLHLLEVLVLRQLVWQVYSLVSAPLGRHHDTPDLLHLRVVRRAVAVEVATDLDRKKVGLCLMDFGIMLVLILVDLETFLLRHISLVAYLLI